jgi:phosphoribosyl 1,2-cyclic phosphodiesterase
MQVRFYGVRGAIPTPGPATVRYGGNSVCVEVRLADGTCVVLDAGTGLRELGKALVAERYHQPILERRSVDSVYRSVVGAGGAEVHC